MSLLKSLMCFTKHCSLLAPIADITHNADDQQCYRWVVVLYNTLNHSNWWNKSHWQLLYYSSLWVYFGAHVLHVYFRFMTGTKNRIILGLQHVKVMCAIQCCSQLLLWLSQLSWQQTWRLFYMIKMAHISAKEFCSKQLRYTKIKRFVSVMNIHHDHTGI